MPALIVLQFIQRRWIAIAALLWVVAVLAGFVVLQVYASRPGRSGQAGDSWPATSRLTHDSQFDTLVMSVHPRCPCSRASIASLAQIMTACEGRLVARVLFFKPAGFPEGWEKTDLWRAACAIPGVIVLCDDDGREARLFGAETSGQVQLYGPDARLLFQGGITATRGHYGANAGEDAVIALVDTGKSSLTDFPVFGCSIQTLSDPSCRKDIP